ncbi:MAG: SGNH/GDSL hydrolase family protein [Candidatus Alcyoniella australis]|nr:SGNH/GDSL hydrolase family protein [Candidatus Alcyoniella australis]
MFAKDDRAGKPRPWYFYFGALFFSLILTLLIIELIVGLLSWAVYERPDFAGMQIGVSGPDSTLIICLGDSHTYGVGAPKGRDYPTTLELVLNERAGMQGFAVLNLGQPGHNSSDALLELESFIEQSPVKPDLLVLCVGKNNMNSLRNASILPEHVREMSLPERLDYMLAHSGAYRISKMTIQRFRELRADRDPRVDDQNFNYGQFVPTRREPFLYQWALQDYRTAADRCAQLGTTLVMMNYWEPFGFVDRAMRLVADENDNVFFVNQNFPIAGMPAYANALISHPDMHPNERGYYRIAKRLAAILIEQGLVHLPDERGPANADEPL